MFIMKLRQLEIWLADWFQFLQALSMTCRRGHAVKRRLGWLHGCSRRLPTIPTKGWSLRRLVCKDSHPSASIYHPYIIHIYISNYIIHSRKTQDAIDFSQWPWPSMAIYGHLRHSPTFGSFGGFGGHCVGPHETQRRPDQAEKMSEIWTAPSGTTGGKEAGLTQKVADIRRSSDLFYSTCSNNDTYWYILNIWKIWKLQPWLWLSRRRLGPIVATHHGLQLSSWVHPHLFHPAVHPSSAVSHFGGHIGVSDIGGRGRTLYIKDHKSAA